jgi:microcystin-dependent protein
MKSASEWTSQNKLLACSGPSGASGPSGPSGPTGPNGNTGPSGETGPSGTNGTNGTNGTTGSTGPTGFGIPVGGIILWSGAVVNIPTGWALCNGANGTPNLMDKFVIGAGSTYSVASTGGSTTQTLTINNLPPHRHQFQQKFGTNSADGSGLTVPDSTQTQYTAGGIYDASNNLVTAEGATPTAFGILPPYYSLAYIMRTS